MNNDIKEITDADKLGFIAGIRAVSGWSHSINRHNGFWEPLEELHKLAAVHDAVHGRGVAETALVQIILGRIDLVHSELSEATEAVRKHPVRAWSSTEKDSLVSEMAGTVVRIMDLCEWLGLPLGEAVIAEVNRNSTRGHMHGNKAA